MLIGFAPLVAMPLCRSLIEAARLAAPPRWTGLALVVLAQLWMLAYPLWMARRRLGRMPHLPGLRAVIIEGLLAFPAALLGMAMMIGTVLGLYYLFGEPATSDGPLERIVGAPDRYERVGMIVMALAVAPIAEELFYRGMLYNALRRLLPTLVAALIQALAFALSHQFGTALRVALVLPGLALAVFYEWRKTLVAPVLMHAMVNALGLAMMLAGIAGNADAPRLGVYGDRQEGGCRITVVVPGGSADVVGIRVGDVVTALDDQPVADIGEIARIIRKKSLGDKVAIAFLRAGTAHQVEAVLKPLPR